MTKHEIKCCPRCGGSFECKVNNPVHCQCAGVTLSKVVLENLRAQFRDCLCIRCLREMAHADAAAQLDTGKLASGDGRG